MKKIKYSEITPENIYKNRRSFIKKFGLAAGSVFLSQNLNFSAKAAPKKEAAPKTEAPKKDAKAAAPKKEVKATTTKKDTKAAAPKTEKKKTVKKETTEVKE